MNYYPGVPREFQNTRKNMLLFADIPMTEFVKTANLSAMFQLSVCFLNNLNLLFLV